MNNPHAERQAVLLERITKNAVSLMHPFRERRSCVFQEKCTELILELNHCVEVCSYTR
jgi:DASH complex subunit DAD4